MAAPSGKSPALRITINRAPVLTLWAAVVAERLGHDRDEALTLGRAVAGLNAQSKGRRLGIFKPAEPGAAKKKPRAKPGELHTVELLGRSIPVVRTRQGLRAASKGETPDTPESVQRYLESKFGESLAAARREMSELAAAFKPAELAEAAFGLYEDFRPEVPRGATGWGAKGVLDLGRVKALARRG